MAESELMRELHSNLWASLRHVFNTDRVLLGVLYLTNFAGFVMLASVSRNEPIAALATVVAMVLLDTLIGLSLSNSKREVLALTSTLIDIYKDHGLGKYFDDSKLQYYRRRYALWTAMVPAVAVAAATLGLIVGFHG